MKIDSVECEKEWLSAESRYVSDDLLYNLRFLDQAQHQTLLMHATYLNTGCHCEMCWLTQVWTHCPPHCLYILLMQCILQVLLHSVNLHVNMAVRWASVCMNVCVYALLSLAVLPGKEDVANLAVSVRIGVWNDLVKR